MKIITLIEMNRSPQYPDTCGSLLGAVDSALILNHGQTSISLPTSLNIETNHKAGLRNPRECQAVIRTPRAERPAEGIKVCWHVNGDLMFDFDVEPPTILQSPCLYSWAVDPLFHQTEARSSWYV